MLSQPTPTVDINDVERVALRDYPPEVAAEILQRVSATELRENVRVVLACLKLARGDHQRFKDYLQVAQSDYREVLAEAEYPLALKRWTRMNELSEQERSSIYQRDWNQYVAWLGRDALVPKDGG
jgi:hypothetical protein